TSSQRISTRSFTLYFELTSADIEPGTLHVSPATVIDVCESAEIVPRASLRSGFGCDGLQEPPPTSTAAPPVVPPPSLAFVNPVAGSNVADRFATSRTAGSCARPAASPAIAPFE